MCAVWLDPAAVSAEHVTLEMWLEAQDALGVAVSCLGRKAVCPWTLGSRAGATKAPDEITRRVERPRRHWCVRHVAAHVS
jgi:hypothetical protein